jgi:hypothetical protein
LFEQNQPHPEAPPQIKRFHLNGCCSIRVRGTRQLVVTGVPDVGIYAVADTAMEIHGVFHTARHPHSRGLHED